MMRVNEVIPSTTDGNRVIAVINARICNDSEYDVLPSAPLLEISAGRPAPSPAILLAMLFATLPAVSWAIAGNDKPTKKVIVTKTANLLAGVILLPPASKFFSEGLLFVILVNFWSATGPR